MLPIISLLDATVNSNGLQQACRKAIAWEMLQTIRL